MLCVLGRQNECGRTVRLPIYRTDCCYNERDVTCASHTTNENERQTKILSLHTFDSMDEHNRTRDERATQHSTVGRVVDDSYNGDYFII